MVDRRKNPSRKKIAPSKPVVREYRVIPNGKRWDVERDHTFTGSFAYEFHTAVGLATAEAQRDAHNGLDATVCVEEKDGSCRQVWP
jgi:hypothetical protein